ncbi:cellulose biosynthesis protein CelA [Sulfolobus acidocaldarius SUSAZ]|nr:cellulose biosynthesis protein CelA [Sulfolobus acidocaldarius SUSAZ]
MAKVLNVLFFLSPLIISAIVTYLTWVRIETVWIDFGLWLAIVTSFYIFLNFYLLLRRSKRYSLKMVDEVKGFKIAAFVTSFNEDPEIVKRTLISVKDAVNARGDVFLLDDSTDENISRELKKFCEKNNINYFHRKDRRGYKAGAINDALKRIEGYDLVAIFDADQRPVQDFFKQVLPYFDDPQVAFVQVPQTYSENYSGISSGAKYQQEPFLRVIMRGRSDRSAFSLGSGTVFRIQALREVGYLPENSITEDAAVSIKLHSKGYNSVYVDLPLIWYGEPPQDLNAYLIQQSRWALGYFQLTKEIINADLSFSKYYDYFAGFLYWIKEGPLAIIEFISPIVFLLTEIPILRINPILYLLVYLPYLFISIGIFVAGIREETEYGLMGFFYHQCVEFLEFTAVTGSFISWLLGKKRPFRVTPKGSGRLNLRILLPYIVILLLLVVSTVKGIFWLVSANPSFLLYYSIIVNIFWAIYHIPFFLGGILISTRFKTREDLTKIVYY